MLSIRNPNTIFFTVMLLVMAVIAIPHAWAEEYTAAIAQTGFPGESPELVRALSRQVESAGYHPVVLTADDLCDKVRLDPKSIDLLVLPDSSTLPMRSSAAIDAYLRGGGDMIALRAPMWQKSMVKDQGAWLTSESYAGRHAFDRPDIVALNPKPLTISKWTRSTDDAMSAAHYEVVYDKGFNGSVMHAAVSNLKGWDTFASPSLTNPFGVAETLTMISAKGDAATPLLSVEWTEKDGARWVGVVRLSPQWRMYLLTPKDFIYWPSASGRGGAGDSFNPANAEKITVGLSFSHTGWTPGKHEYWVGTIGTTQLLAPYSVGLSMFSMPPLDQCYPAYKLFECHDVSQLRSASGQCIIDSMKMPAPRAVSSPQPRSKGGGFDKGRAWRWIPLMEVTTASGQWRGNPITMTVNTAGDYKGSVWASFGIQDAEWYQSSAALRMVRQVAQKIRNGIFIIDGGANYYTYFDDQLPKIGVHVVNLSRDTHQGMAAVSLKDSSGIAKASGRWDFSLAPGEDRVFAEDGRSVLSTIGPFSASAAITESGRLVDEVSHEVHVWRPKPVKKFVTVRGGGFMLDGKRWRAHGVNYWPSSAIGSDDGDYASFLFSPAAYDPDVIERDLDRICGMGLNSVSTAIMLQSIESQNLLDFLRRCENHKLKVNLHLGAYVSPMNYKWELVKPIIDRYRLWENDTVFAYDLAWEIAFGPYDARKQWDSDWESWVVERYGSIGNAEKDWGSGMPRDPAGKATGPDGKQLSTNGLWFRMVAAYRRFADTLVYKKYNAARNLIRAVDPNHGVSFRWTESGNPTFRSADALCYDFPYLGAGVDFYGPEAYGRIGNREMVKPAGFERTYARWADPSRPMVWTEMGFPVWDLNSLSYSPARMKAQADFYRDFYDVMAPGGHDGIFYWWYPGGFRSGEKSDFGIINPDGSDRPVTKVIRANARRFLDAPAPKSPNFRIAIDRDAHPDGVAGIYDSIKGKYWNAVKAGKTPGLVTTGTGTTSANCPLIAVGNRPCNGANPPKYLDGVFDSFEVMDADGRWVTIENGGKVEVPAGRPAIARVKLMNLGEASWINGLGTGSVLVTVDDAGLPLPRPVASLSRISVTDLRLTEAMPSTPTDVVVGLLASGRTHFGERFRVTLEPR